MFKTIFSRWTLRDEVQGSISRLERDRLQIVLHMIEQDAKRQGVEGKLAFLSSWLNPPEPKPPELTPAAVPLKDEKPAA